MEKKTMNSISHPTNELLDYQAYELLVELVYRAIARQHWRDFVCRRAGRPACAWRVDPSEAYEFIDVMHKHHPELGAFAENVLGLMAAFAGLDFSDQSLDGGPGMLLMDFVNIMNATANAAHVPRANIARILRVADDLRAYLAATNATPELA